MPGGLIKRHEDVADCARREVTEEVGLAVELASEPAVVVDSRPQRVDVVFWARPAAGADANAVSPRSPEIREVRWFPADELPDLQHETVTALGAPWRRAWRARRPRAARTARRPRSRWRRGPRRAQRDPDRETGESAGRRSAAAS